MSLYKFFHCIRSQFVDVDILVDNNEKSKTFLLAQRVLMFEMSIEFPCGDFRDDFLLKLT